MLKDLLDSQRMAIFIKQQNQFHMKKLFVLAAFCLTAMGVTAQIEKGTVLVGASSNLGFTSVKPDGGDSESAFSLDIKAGYFFVDNFTAGLNLSLATTDGFSQTGIGVFGRYYINGKIFLGAGYNAIAQKYESTPDDIKVNYGMIPLEAGYAAFLTPNIAVEPSLNFGIMTGDADGTSFGLNVGFAIYLNRKGGN
jgi:hypothetical protein